MKKEMMEDVYTPLATCPGQPPVSFEARPVRTITRSFWHFTPQEFFAETVDMNLDDYISIISAPTADKLSTTLTPFPRLGNVVMLCSLPQPGDLELKLRLWLSFGLDNLPVWSALRCCSVPPSQEHHDTRALLTLTAFGFPVVY